MPDNESAQLQKEKVLTRLYEHHKIEKSQRTSSRTLECATSALDYWLRTGGSTTSPEVRVLLEVMEEEVRWLKRRNDEQERRQRHPVGPAKRLTIRARAPSQMPEATFKMLRRVGCRYDPEERTWSAWDDETTRAAAEAVAEQGRLW